MSASSSSVVASERVRSPFQAAGSAATASSPVVAAPSPAAASSDGVDRPRAELTTRPMTGYEEEYLEVAAGDANTARLCNGLLARCTVPPGAEPGEAVEAVRSLWVAERDRALIELRRKSLGDRVATEVDCPACGETNEVDFDLAALPVAIPTVAEPLAVSLRDDRRALLRLPTAGDQEAMLDAPTTSAAGRRTRLLARLLLKLDGDPGPFSEDAVRAMPTAERRALEDAVDRATPDLSLDMAVTCCECGCEFTSPFDVAVFFCLR